MSDVEYMPLSKTNGMTVQQWLGSRGIVAVVEADDRLRVSLAGQGDGFTVAADVESSVEKLADVDVLIAPGVFLVTTYVTEEKRHFLRVAREAPKPGEDTPASVG